jgi:hypothetical protein
MNETFIKHAKIDPAYISALDDEIELRISAKYTAFKKGSSALVTSFKNEKDKHGSINNIPRDILHKYSIPFSSLLDISRNLRDDLTKQLNSSNKVLEYLREHGSENNPLGEKVSSRREKLCRKIEYFDDVEILYTAIEFRKEKG